MLDADDIIAEAEATVGVPDTDTAPRANLARLVAVIHAEAGLGEAGLAMARRQLLRDTIARLEGLKWLARHPEIADEPITRPVFLMGLPRSGTTFLQYLFDLDPRFRLIRTWESLTPFPPPGADPASAARRRAEWAALRARETPQVAGFDALHLIDEDGADECHAFLEQSFGAAGLANLFRVPSYFDYLLDEADLAETYRIHRRQLQLLQWRGGPVRWALKYPNHLLALDAILAVYPDASFVMTHRDPAQVVASIARMSAKLRGARVEGSVDPRDVGQDMAHFIARHVERLMAFDRGPHGHRVVHVDYYRLERDPLASLRDIHAALDLDTPPEYAARIRQWHAANPRHARGANRYGTGEFGLSAQALREAHAGYITRFAIPPEHAATLSD